MTHPDPLAATKCGACACDCHDTGDCCRTCGRKPAPAADAESEALRAWRAVLPTLLDCGWAERGIDAKGDTLAAIRAALLRDAAKDGEIARLTAERDAMREPLSDDEACRLWTYAFDVTAEPTPEQAQSLRDAVRRFVEIRSEKP